MKKLTKTLSLVLVVAMVLSLCVIGASATFTDKDKVTTDYSEAVGIMTDLAVVKGYTDGSFKPAGTLTRAEACVLMANMTLGTAQAAALAPTSVTFKDVPASYWGYKYVEYCYQCGYIAGTGAGNFTPGATLTGYQWALMLMRVLNYDLSSLTTGNWQINTAKVYYADDTSFSSVAVSGAAVTREAATQMAYDALFHATGATSGYALRIQKNDDVKNATLDVIVGYYGTAAEAANAANLYNSFGGGKTPNKAGSYYGDTTDSTIKTGTSLASTKFGVTLTKGQVGPFGRPGNLYTAKGSTAAASKALAKTYGWSTVTNTKFVAQTAVVTYTAATKAATVFADLSGYYSAAGVKVDTAKAAEYAAMTANGKIVEFYANSTGVLTVVPIVFKVATVASVVAPTSSKAYTTYTLQYSDTSKSYIDYTDADTADEIVLTGAVAKGDVVTVATSSGVAFVYPTTVVAGAESAYSTTNSTITVGAKTYGIGEGVEKNLNNATAKVSMDDYKAISTTAANYYVDQFGYVVGSSSVTSNSFAYIVSALGSVTTTLDGSTPAVSVRAVLQDGTVGDYTLSLTKNSATGAYSAAGVPVYATGDASANVTSKATTAFTGKVFAYAVSGTTIALYPVADGTAPGTAQAAANTNYGFETAAAIGSGQTTIETTVSTHSTPGTYALMNNATVYVCYNSTTNKAVVYTGNTAVPSTVSMATGAKMVAMSGSDNNIGAAKIVFSASSTDTAAVSKNLVYIDATSIDSVTADASHSYFTYTGIDAAGADVANLKATDTALEKSGIYTVNTDNSISNSNLVASGVSASGTYAGIVLYSTSIKVLSNGLVLVDGNYYNYVSGTSNTVYLTAAVKAADPTVVTYTGYVVLATTSAGAPTASIATLYLASSAT